MLKPVHAQLLACLHREDRLSRAQLHRRTGVRPNTVGLAVDELVQAGVLRLGPRRATGRGPRHESIEIDDTGRFVAGLAIAPGRVQACRLDLKGRVMGEVQVKRGRSTEALLTHAVALAEQVADPRDCLGLGISIPGFVDVATRRVNTSSAFPGATDVDLSVIGDAVPGVPLVVDSEIHSVSTRWLLSQRQSAERSVLLVSLRDGEIGASLLVDGKPYAGSLRAGNELGHTQLPVQTERCYCGQVGCIERVFSDAYLRKMKPARPRTSLNQAIEAFDDGDGGIRRVVDLLAMAIGNAVNFSRPDRLVLAGTLMLHERFVTYLTQRVAGRVFRDLASRLQIQVWPEDCAASAETAGWLALCKTFGFRD